MKRYVSWAIAALGLGVLWLFRPWFHGLLMLFYVHPLSIILIATLAGGIWWLADRWVENERLSWPIMTIIASVVGLIAYAIIARDLQRWVAVGKIEYHRRNELPETRIPRILPYAVAERYGVDALQEPTQTTYQWQPVLADGKMAWVSARVPDGIVRYFFKKTAGLEVVRADLSAREVKFVNQTLEVSEGVAVTDSIYWQLFKHRYFVDLPEVLYAIRDGQIFAVVPVIAYRGFLIRYPVFDGYFTVYPNGRVEERRGAVDPKDPLITACGRVFPESLARFQHEAFAFRRGLLNNWFLHEDQIEISDPEGELNGQPYLLDMVNGLQWVTAADPYGTSFAVFKIFLTSALTGKVEILEIPKESALTGAQQAIGYVRSTYPQLNWEKTSGSTTSGNIVAVEPRPEVVHNKLFWMISVTTSDHKGVNLTAFVDAKTNKVVGLDSDEKVLAFVREEVVSTQVETVPALPVSPTTTDTLKKLEDLLRQALRELEELKKR